MTKAGDAWLGTNEGDAQVSSRRGIATLVVLAAMPTMALAQNSPEPGVAQENIMLCDSPEHAIAFTVAINEGASDDMAKDIVGKAAGAEVCDKFIGRASIEEQKTLKDKGFAYTVTAYKFKGVGAMKWAAIPQDRE